MLGFKVAQSFPMKWDQVYIPNQHLSRKFEFLFVTFIPVNFSFNAHSGEFNMVYWPYKLWPNDQYCIICDFKTLFVMRDMTCYLILIVCSVLRHDIKITLPWDMTAKILLRLVITKTIYVPKRYDRNDFAWMS